MELPSPKQIHGYAMLILNFLCFFSVIAIDRNSQYHSPQIVGVPKARSELSRPLAQIFAFDLTTTSRRELTRQLTRLITSHVPHTCCCPSLLPVNNDDDEEKEDKDEDGDGAVGCRGCGGDTAQRVSRVNVSCPRLLFNEALPGTQ